MAKMIVTPDSGLIDELVKIEVSGLDKEESITILAKSVQSDATLQSYAYYKANKDGVANTYTDTSLGGDFSGIEPMGLFWSMKRPEGNYANSLRPDFSTSFSVCVDVYRGHLDESNFKISNAICSTSIKRLHVSSSISRIPVCDDNIEGILFVPNAPGVYPGIVDIRGGAGLIENRPSLLAAKGFVTLALQYSGYDSQNEILDIEYFEKALTFLSKHEKVRNIGVVGYSLGGVITLAMMGCLPSIKCAVLICSPIYPFSFKFKYKDKIWDSEKRDATKYITTNDTLYRQNVFPKIGSKDVHKFTPPFQNSEANVLSIQCEEDGLGYNAKIQDTLQEVFERSGKTDYEFFKYEGAGHLLNVPYVPLSSKAYFNDVDDIPSFFGGKPLQHARAQEHAWKEIVTFLKQNLKCDNDTR